MKFVEVNSMGLKTFYWSSLIAQLETFNWFYIWLFIALYQVRYSRKEKWWMILRQIRSFAWSVKKYIHCSKWSNERSAPQLSERGNCDNSKANFHCPKTTSFNMFICFNRTIKKLIKRNSWKYSKTTSKCQFC